MRIITRHYTRPKQSWDSIKIVRVGGERVWPTRETKEMDEAVKRLGTNGKPL